MKEQSAISIVENAYLEYGKFVNSLRSLPSIYDGFKPVQRRLLLATEDSRGNKESVSSANIVGRMISKYHPHGDAAIYSALVNMVNQKYSLFNKQGNFGYNGYTTTAPAAMRYTEVSLSDLAINTYLRYRKDSALSRENEQFFAEPSYLPTPIPYCFLNGCFGIGVGLNTFIPAITKRSINSFLRAYFKDKEIPNLSPSSAGGHWISIEKEDLITLNEKGYGSARLGACVRKEYDEDKRVITVVSKVPRGISYKRITACFRKELEEKYIYIRPETRPETRVIVGRYPRIRKITDEEIYERLRKTMQKTFSYKIYVSDGERAKLIGLKEFMITSIETCLDAYGRSLMLELSNGRDKIKFLEIRKELAKMLIEDKSSEEIRKELSLSLEEYNSYTSRTISSLRSTKEDKNFILENIRFLSEKISNIKKYFLKDHTL